MMTPDEEARLLKMLEDHEWATKFWLKTGIWAKWLVSVAAAIAAGKYLFADLFRGLIK